MKDGGVDNHNLNLFISQLNEEFSVKNIISTGALSPLKSFSPNNTRNISGPHRTLSETPEKNNNYSSSLKSPDNENYYGHHLIPGEIKERNTSAFCTQESSPLQSTPRKRSEKESSLQPLLANYIYKLDENMKMAKRIDSKLDISIMNQEKNCRYLLPGEKVVKRPSGLPSFPVETQDELDHMEKFLHDDNNLSAACFYFAKFIDSKSIENSVRKLLAKLMRNSLASNYSFHGSRAKRIFEKLKI